MINQVGQVYIQIINSFFGVVSANWGGGLSDVALSDTSISKSDHEEVIHPQSSNKVQVYVRNPRLLSEHQSGSRIYTHTVHARLESGEVKPYTFTFDRKPLPGGIFSEDFPSRHFNLKASDSRISYSFWTTQQRNVMVLITNGYYENEHGVIVRSYVRKKSVHTVLTAYGCVTTMAQVHLQRLHPSFCLPFGVPVE